MMLRVNGEFLDFRTPIEMERQVKLFDNITGLDGDYSYQFQIENNSYNRDKLGIVGLDSNSRFPFEVNSTEMLNDNGVVIYTGSLRVESAEEFINASFFANNSSWFTMLNVPMRNSFNWELFSRDQSTPNIRASQTYSEGITWPLVNRGVLHERSSPIVYEEDMQPFIYVKDVIKHIMAQKGLKLDGDIITDSIYNNLITSNGGVSGIQQRVDQRKIYAGITSEILVTWTTPGLVLFDNTAAPYFNSPLNNWEGLNYDPDVDLKEVKIEINIRTRVAVDNPYMVNVQVLVGSGVIYSKSMATTDETLTITDTIVHKTGVAESSSISVTIHKGGSIFFNEDFYIISGSYIKITPVKFYKVYADQLLPDMNANEFVQQIFSLSCCATKFNGITNTIHTRLFKNIENQTEIDLSPYLVRIVRDDYTEFIADYTRNNVLQYAPANDDGTELYNVSNATPYGAGVIEVDNAYIGERDTILDLDFVACFQRPVSWLGNSLPLLNYCESEETDDSVEVTSVTDNGDGYARFNYSGTLAAGANDLIRLSDFTESDYEGDYRIITDTGTYVLLADVLFSSNATGTMTALEIIDSNNEDQVLLLNAPNRQITDFSGLESLNYNGGSNETLFALGFFYLQNTLQPINETLREALYFDPVNDPQATQISLKEKYYRSIERMLNNPRKLVAEFEIPEPVFQQLDSFSPIRVKTDKFNLRFYLNRITGYQNQHIACELELIKM